jgi:cold shock CspA family protein
MAVSAPRRSAKLGRPNDPAGSPAAGRIARLLVGQSYGFIRARNARDVFFHRSDLRDGTSFNTLQVGDPVIFDLIEDGVSGARAVRVARRTPASGRVRER